MDLMQRVSVKLIYSNPFYGHLLLQTRKIRDDNFHAPMGVGIIDGMIELRYNQVMLEKILEQYKNKWEYLVAIVEHEMLHVIFKHSMRRQDRNAIASVGARPITVWNMAADIAINQLIDKPLPLNPLQYKDFNMPRGLSAEQYYDLLIEEAKRNGSYVQVDALGDMMGNGQQGSGGGGGEGEDESEGKDSGQGDGEGEDKFEGTGGAWDTDENMKDKDLVDGHDLWRDVNSDIDKTNDIENSVIKSAVRRAKTSAKRMGKLPSNVEEAISEILTPATIPWNKMLRRYVGDSFKVAHSYTWKRPSRRFGGEQKGKKPIKTLKIDVIIDTSGSVGTEEFSLFISEINSIRDSYPTEINIIECDAAVQKVYKLRKKVDIKFKGRGGTDFRPPFIYIEKKKRMPGLVIYFTDLCGTFPDTVPPYPVIWVKTPDRYGWATDDVPFGQLIKIEESNRRAA